MEILDLKTTIVLYVRNINFQISVVKYNNTNERAGLRWRVDYKDSDCDHGSTTIDDGESGIRINNHDYLNYKSKGLFLSSYVIGFPKTYRKIIIIFLQEQEGFWSEYTYRTIFNSLNSIIKNKYDYQRFN